MLKTASLVAQRYAASQQLKTLEKLIADVYKDLQPLVSGWRPAAKTDRALRAVQSLPGTASDLLQYLEISFEDQEKFKQLKGHKHFTRLTNFKKLVTAYTKIQSFEDALTVTGKQGTKAQNALQKFSEYATEAVGLVRYFDTEIVDTLRLQNYTVTLINARGRDITQDDVQKLDEVLKRANALLVKAGLGSSTGGRLSAYPGKSLGGATGSSGAAAASYNIPGDFLRVAVGHSLHELVHSFVHELGHRVYFKSLGSQGRAAWKQFFGDNQGDPGLDRMIKEWEDWSEKQPASKKGSLAYFIMDGSPSARDKVFLELIGTKFVKEVLDPYGRKGRGVTALDQVKAKRSEINVFLMPVSWYSGTSADELFAEVLAYMLVDGPQTVEPLVRDVFGRAVPALRTASSEASRYRSVQVLGGSHDVRTTEL